MDRLKGVPQRPAFDNGLSLRSEATPGLLLLLVTKERNICYFGKSKD